MNPNPAGQQALSLSRVLICGAMIVTLSMGIRHGFGLWLQPVVVERGWTREAFSFALAVQNLCWGLAGTLAGALSDRFGAMRVLIVGAALYALGLAGMAVADSPWGFTAAAGITLGIAQAATTYAVVYGIVGRNVSAERRSWAMGMVAAAGSFGQFLMLPVEHWLIAHLGWQQALQALAVLALLIAPLALALREPATPAASGGAAQQTLGQALREAFGYRSFQLLMAGYFVCGFQLVFIGAHLPSYLKDKGLEPQVAVTALALVGLFNIFGTYAAGVLGQRLAKKNILAVIYAARSAAIVGFLLLPLTPASVYLFAAAMGLLWLSTVPPTNAIVAQIFGVRFMGTLSGFVFLSHQVGSFVGVWLGGLLYDRTGGYEVVWWLAVLLGLFAAIVNLPVRETAILRAQPRAA